METIKIKYRFGEEMEYESVFALIVSDDTAELLLHTDGKELEWDDMVKRLRLMDHISNMAKGYAALSIGDPNVQCKVLEICEQPDAEAR